MSCLTTEGLTGFAKICFYKQPLVSAALNFSFELELNDPVNIVKVMSSQ